MGPVLTWMQQVETGGDGMHGAPQVCRHGWGLRLVLLAILSTWTLDQPDFLTPVKAYSPP